jgi:hypothetical protein
MRAVVFAFLGSAVAGCAGAPPPMSHVVTSEASADATTSKLVFLWPSDSCEGGGYHVITTRDGRFIGTVGRGTRLETTVAPGSYAFMTWNPEMERFGRAPSISDTGVLRADVSAGQTYFVRLAFGEWNDRGPAESWSRTGKGGSIRRCVGSGAALVAVAPRSQQWPRLRTWLDELTPIAAETEAGEQWLASRPSSVQTRRELAEAREQALSDRARELASIKPTDGVPDRP